MTSRAESDSPGFPEAPLAGDSASRSAFLEELLVHYLLRVEEGETPDPDEYLGRYPRYAEDLAGLLNAPEAPPPGSEDGGRFFGDYELLTLVSAAGGGKVYRARRRSDGLVVALKVLGKRESIDERELTRFRHEARMLAELRIDGIIPALEVGERDEALFLVMPWIEGISLQQAIAALRGADDPGVVDPEKLDLPRRVSIIAEIAEILLVLQERGILHRDLKPSNLMIDAELRPILIDFGIARHDAYTQITKTADAPLGTPRFLAPELLAGDAKAATPRSDLYALAMTLTELLTLEPVFPGRDRITLYRQIDAGIQQSPAELEARIPPKLAKILMSAMARDPMKRPASLASFIKSLAPYREAAGWTAQAASGGSRRVVGIALLILFVAAICVWLLAGLL